jgi:TolB-like protein/Tfp pilus assembly protein PilF
MPGKPHPLSLLWKELKRRKVIRVITVYAAVAFVILQLVEILAPSLRLPDWTMNFILALLIVGFIIAVILSWIYDIKPEGGLEKTEPVKGIEIKEVSASSNGWKIASYISIVVIIALILINILPRISGQKKISRMEKSIAVLPFYFYSSDKEAEDIGDAFANEITTQLCKVSGFDRVISHTSTRQFKGSDKLSIPEIGKILNANFIIEGTLERQYEDVSIHIQIIEAAGDDHLWANDFKGKWKDIFIIRAEIAKEVARELLTILSPEEIKEIERVPTEHMDAYEYYLLGSHLLDEGTSLFIHKAMDHFEKSIKIDPGFIQSYVKLAYCYGNLAFFGSLRPAEAYPEMLRLASLILEMDSLSGEAFEVKSLVDYYYHFDYSRSEQNINRALELNPLNSKFYRTYAEFYNYLGRFDESIDMDRKAMIMDPLYPYTSKLPAIHLYFAGEKDSAYALLKTYYGKRDKRRPWLGFLYMQESEFILALSELEHVTTSDSPFMQTQLGLLYHKLGEAEKTREILEALEARAKKEFVSYTLRGALLAELGEEEKALEYLSKGYEEREEYVMMLMHFDKLSYEGLRNHPDFLDILRKVQP